MEQGSWFFDLISPFSYLHHRGMRVLRDRLDIQPVPVLFAGLLKHWGTKGPAEVPSKRLHTYQYCVWAAGRRDTPFRMPPRHPFNPLLAQRLLIALGATDPVVEAAFDFAYGQGRDPEHEFEAFADRLGAPDATSLIASPAVKQQLIVNTQRAIGLGVFGVSTLVVRERLFWGSDTVDWVTQFLDNPAMFDRSEYRAAARSEFGVARS